LACRTLDSSSPNIVFYQEDLRSFRLCTDLFGLAAQTLRLVTAANLGTRIDCARLFSQLKLLRVTTIHSHKPKRRLLETQPSNSVLVRKQHGMWGWPLDFWDDVAFWTLAIGSVFAGIGIALTGFSSFVSLRASAVAQLQAEEKIADARSRGEQAQTEAAKANARAAEANQKAEEEKLARLKIEERLADRKLNNEQLDTIARQVRDFAGQEYKITTFWDLREPLAFSNLIHAALQRAQWHYVPHGEGGSFLLGGVAGVAAYVNPLADEVTKNAASAIVKALKAENVDAELKQQNTQEKSNVIYLNIGTKP
jgi:hypothetical protein